MNKSHEISGTVYLILFLLLTFQVQLLAVRWGGYSSVRTLLSSVLSIHTSLFLGPFLHNSALHLVENLIVLLVALGYLEYTSQPVRRLYGVYIVTGWFGLLGAIYVGAPAIGASASASGLTGCAAVASLWYFTGSVRKCIRRKADFPGLYVHSTFALYFVSKTLTRFLTLNLQDGGKTSHASGALIGSIIGVSLLFSGQLSR